MFAIEGHDAETLKTFRERFANLTECKFLYDPTPLSYSSHVSKTEPVTHSFSGKDYDYFKSYLITFRQFYLTNEPIQVFRVCNVLYRVGSRVDLREAVTYSRQYWSDALTSRDGMYWSSSSKVYDLDNMLKLFLYGEIAHSDPEWVEEMRNTPDFMKNSMLLLLQIKLGKLYLILRNLDAVCDVILNEPTRILRRSSDT